MLKANRLLMIEKIDKIDQPVPMDWNTYQNEPSELNLYPGNQLVKTKKVPGKDYMVRVVNMLDKKYIRDLLENGRPKLHYKDEKGKRQPLGKSAIKYYLKLKYVRSIPPNRETSLDESSTHRIKNLMVTDDQGKDHLKNVEEVYDAQLFDELFFHDKHMTYRPTDKGEVTAGENVYGTDSKKGDEAHVQIAVKTREPRHS